jgi:hypothetical protein
MTAVHGPEQGELTFTDPSPLRDSDRRLILGAILVDARHHDGHVDPNRVRESLRDMGGDLMVRPRMLSGAWSGLLRGGVIEFHEWTVNTDRIGGNNGRPSRRYRVIDMSELERTWEAA